MRFCEGLGWWYLLFLDSDAWLFGGRGLLLRVISDYDAGLT